MNIFAVLCLAAVALAKHEIYDGYKSYYVSVESRDQQMALGPLTEQFEVDVLSPPLLQREGVVLVAPQHQQGFTQALLEAGIQHRIHRNDVKAALDYDDNVNEDYRMRTRAMNGGRILPYHQYSRHAEIDEYLEHIAREFSDTVTLVHAANSYEGRPIKYLKISTTNFEDTRKPVIFIDGGIHSREWISPPTVTWAIRMLTEDLTDPELLEKFDWILLPLVNPDGYEFTFTDSRFWRKTRSTNHTLGNFCPGVDGNRNYDYTWNTVGSSSNPCSDTFAGLKPFSEIETVVVRDVLLEHLHRISLYITMHSYGSMILYPWGDTGLISSNGLFLHVAGVNMAQAMDQRKISYFPEYVVGNSLLVIGYGASGASEDYAHFIGVPLSYTIELPGLSGGFQGFHLSEMYIERVSQETWAGIVEGAWTALSFYGRK